MKITSIKFYRVALLFPYLTIVLLFPFLYLGLRTSPFESNAPLHAPGFTQILTSLFAFLAGIITIISFVYFFGAPYWLIPYTILVICLWVWSLKKNKSQIHKMFNWSPIYLAILTTVFYAVISYFKLFNGLNYLGDDISGTTFYCIFPASIVFGYLFIGMTAWIYDFLRRRGVIMDEEIILNLESVRN